MHFQQVAECRSSVAMPSISAHPPIRHGGRTGIRRFLPQSAECLSFPASKELLTFLSDVQPDAQFHVAGAD
jgi:hypothetical protein